MHTNKYSISKTFLFLSILLLAHSSKLIAKENTNQAGNESTNAALPEWTIMVFMDGDNNLEGAAIDDFNEMSRVGGNDKVNIVAQVDLIGKYYNVGWTQTLRFNIKKGTNPTVDESVEDIGEANMGDPKILSNFITWSMTNYPAKKFALIIWDHGQGYRLMSANANLTKNINQLISNQNFYAAKVVKPVNPINLHVTDGDPFRSSTQNPFKSCSNDETNNDELYNREIQDGLTSALSGKKLDVLGFDACLMGMVETCYAYRNICNAFVGSEELEPGSGWDYDDWIRKLLANPAMEEQELSKILVESYGETSGIVSESTLSAVDLKGFNNVAEKISIFANNLKKNLYTNLSVIKEARKDCATFAPNPYNEQPPKDYFFHIDFIRFCDKIIEKTTNAELKNDAANAKDAVEKAILKNYRGNLRNGKFGSNGLAIYFPISKSQYKSDLFEKGGYKKDNTFFPVEFVQNQTWADFLQAYFLKVP